MTIVVTKATGGRSMPLGAVYVPSEVAMPDPSGTTLAASGVDATFVSDLLSACVAHERCGATLYRSVAGRTADAQLREQYEHFGAETVEHVDLLERLIASAGGDPAYVSPAARATERANGVLLESTFLLDGSIDAITAELSMLEAVMLAEAKDHHNWELLNLLAAAMPAGDLQSTFQETATRVLGQEEEHYQWSHDTLAAMRFQLATGRRMPTATPRAGGGDDLEAMRRDELYAKAQELDIPGRSNMNRDELAAAIRSQGEEA